MDRALNGGPVTFEELAVGDVGVFGPRIVSAEEIVAFARRFDPLPFHLDADAAGASAFGGLVGSAWHTGSVMNGLVSEGWTRTLAVVGGTAIDDVRITHPLRPGDALSVRVAVVGLRRSPPPHTGGKVSWSWDVRNQDRVRLMSGISTMIVAGRPGGPAVA